MAQASSFLKKRAEERRKALEKQNGASVAGGSTKTTQSSQNMPLGGGQNGAPSTKASDFLRKRAEERAAIIDKQYGADAVVPTGGSRTGLLLAILSLSSRCSRVTLPGATLCWAA